MTDPAPLTDVELAAIKNDLRRDLLTRNQAERLVATVEQARRERDAAQAVIRRLWTGGGQGSGWRS